ncbi:hypothetical protein BDA99DRAFT_543225 [Phascolomyces articulosus]|uniref:Uncharacterized protein n=1 Tax=Phascolomyces articulosus TaxID=60185 RepID=A0AAD5JP24_9FUNG|nr:hypothetical protein BDA99DRAFT_543225 [Phascolomyces articulosus]
MFSGGFEKAIIPVMSRYIEYFHIFENKRFLSKCADLFEENYFTKIHTLCFHETGERRSFVVFDRDMIYYNIMMLKILPNISKTLHTLSLNCYDTEDDGPSLKVILMSCENLANFKYETRLRGNQVFLGMNKFTGITRLTKFELKVDLYHVYPGESKTRAIDIDEMGFFLRCSPSLTYLKLGGYTSEDILPMVQKYCPGLTHLLLHQKIMLFFSDTKTHNSDGLQLHTLVLGGHYPKKQLLTLFRSSHSTLVTLCLSTYEEEFTNRKAPEAPTKKGLKQAKDFWDAISKFKMNSLKHLPIHQESWFASEATKNSIEKIIRQSLNLQTLELRRLQGRVNGITNGLAAAIATQKHLSKLYLNDSEFVISPPSTIHSLLANLPVEHLSMTNCRKLGGDALKCIAEWKHLKDIQLGNSKAENATPEVFSNLHSCFHSCLIWNK